MKQNIDFKNIVHLPVDDGFPIQSTPLTEEDDRIIRAFIKKSKANQCRRELYAKRKRKTAETPVQNLVASAQ